MAEMAHFTALMEPEQGRQKSAHAMVLHLEAQQCFGEQQNRHEWRDRHGKMSRNGNNRNQDGHGQRKVVFERHMFPSTVEGACDCPYDCDLESITLLRTLRGFTQAVGLFAGRHRSGFKAGLKGLRPLSRGTVGERLGRNAPAGHALEPVVSDRRRRLQARRDVGLIHDAALRRGIAPNSGEAICLELEANGEPIGGAGVSLLFRVNAAFDAQ